MRRPARSPIHLAILLALAAGVPAQLATAPDASAQTQAQRGEARQHYQRALALYDEERFQAALVEFQAAYDAVANPRLLYNLGVVNASLGRSVEAVDALEGYLQGGGEIAADRRAAVEALLERHRQRIGRVHLRVNVQGAVLSVDGVDVGTAPMAAPVRLSVGSHVFAARATGHDQPRSRVDVVGGAQITVELTLQRSEAARGALRIASVPTGVTVLIAGREVGVTPLDGTLSVEPGQVQVLGRRAGYLDARATAEVDDGAETRVRLELQPDPAAPPEQLGRLRLQVPAVRTELRVDGRATQLAGSVVELPVGIHDLRVEVAGREPVRESVEVPSDDELLFAPALRWTDDARRDRIGGESTRRTVGWVVGAGGLVVAGVAAGFLIWNEGVSSELDRLDAQLNGPGGCLASGLDCAHAMLEAEATRYEQLRGRPTGAIRAGSLLGLAAGVAGVAVGLTLVLTSDSDEEVDAAASASAAVRLGPGGLALLGAF